MRPVLQKQIPHDPLNPKSLPGVQPLDLENWLTPDDAFAGQMQLRDQLLEQKRDQVTMLDSTAMPAAQELLQTVLGLLYPDETDVVRRADGRQVDLNWEDPLGTLGRITQQDFCILEKHGDEHVMTGAVLCFPASWTLAEKFMKPLTGIHVPVASYDDGIAARVQRMFNGVQVGRPLWRYNSLWYQDPTLHQPRSQFEPRDKTDLSNADYMRSEKQVILRLPETRAVVFSIHTIIVARSDVLAQWGDEGLLAQTTPEL